MRIENVLKAVTLGGFICVSQSTAASPMGYSESFDTLYQVDLGTRTAIQLGSAGYYGGSPIANIQGLAYMPNGGLYAVVDAGVQRRLLVQINTNGIANVVGSLGITEQGSGSENVLDFSLTATCDGKLWLASGVTNDFWQVNPTNGTATKIGNLGVSNISGMASVGTTVFAFGSKGNPNIYTVNSATAQTILLGSYTKSSPPLVTTISGAFDSTNKFWAILNNVPPYQGTSIPEWSDEAQFNASTYYLVDNGNITGNAYLQYVGLTGLAIQPPAVCSATLRAWPNPVLIPFTRPLPGQPVPSKPVTMTWNAPGYGSVDLFKQFGGTVAGGGPAPTALVTTGGSSGSATINVTAGDIEILTILPHGMSGPILGKVKVAGFNSPGLMGALPAAGFIVETMN